MLRSLAVAASAAAAAASAGGHGHFTCSVNPALGTHGFPDCEQPGPVTDDLDAMQMSMVCKQRGSAAAIKIGTIGDSITAGACSSGGNHTYPAQLQIMLDTEYGAGVYAVTNLGACGSTMQKAPNGDSPYWQRPQYTTLTQNKWDILVILLGTNDAKDPIDGGPNKRVHSRRARARVRALRRATAAPARRRVASQYGRCCWRLHCPTWLTARPRASAATDSTTCGPLTTPSFPLSPPCSWHCGIGEIDMNNCPYVTDYLSMIARAQTLGTTPGTPPTIYAMIPVPLMQHGSIGANQTVINSVYPTLIPLIAAKAGLKTVPINNFAGMGGVSNWPAVFPNGCADPSPWPACPWWCDAQHCDQCHPNDDGYHHLAGLVKAGLGL